MNWTIILSVLLVSVLVYGIVRLWYAALVEKMKHDSSENAHNLELVNQGLTSDNEKLIEQYKRLELDLEISNQVNRYLAKMLKGD